MGPILWSLAVGSLGGPLGGLAAGLLATTWLQSVSDRTRAAMLSSAAGFILAVAFLELVGRARGKSGDSDQTAYSGAQARKIAWSLVVVNIVEGVTLGIGFAVGQRLGLLLAAEMIFENFVEGMSVWTELAGGGHAKRKVYWMTTAPTVTLGIGGAIGAYLADCRRSS